MASAQQYKSVSDSSRIAAARQTEYVASLHRHPFATDAYSSRPAEDAVDIDPEDLPSDEERRRDDLLRRQMGSDDDDVSETVEGFLGERADRDGADSAESEDQ